MGAPLLLWTEGGGGSALVMSFLGKQLPHLCLAQAGRPTARQLPEGEQGKQQHREVSLVTAVDGQEPSFHRAEPRAQCFLYVQCGR